MDTIEHFFIRKVANGWVVCSAAEYLQQHGFIADRPREWVFPTIWDAAVKMKELSESSAP